MCPSCELMEYYQLDPLVAPSHFMRGTAAEVWGNNTHKVMREPARKWAQNNVLNMECSFPTFYFISNFDRAINNKDNTMVVSDDHNSFCSHVSLTTWV